MRLHRASIETKRQRSRRAMGRSACSKLRCPIRVKGNLPFFGGHLLREQGVGSSNLPAPTNEINGLEFLASTSAADIAPETKCSGRGKKRSRKKFAILLFVEPCALDVE